MSIQGRPYSRSFLRTLCGYFTVVFLVSGPAAKVSGQIRSASLQALDSTIAQSDHFDSLKRQQIDLLKRQVPTDGAPSSWYDYYLKLYGAYHIFNYDSANTYARKMLALANQSGNDSLRAYAKVKLGFILLSSGMFKEVFDTLANIHLGHLNEKQQAEYYTLLARSYFDLADYDRDNFYSPQYYIKGNSYLDSALIRLPKHQFEYDYYNGLKSVMRGQTEEASFYLGALAKDSTLSLHQQALVTSTLSDIYVKQGNTNEAIELLIRAATADIRSSTKETSATYNLATLLFKRGFLERASVYIQKAASDAVFYGARQRKVQLSSILPLIESERLNAVEREKRRLITYAAIITAFFLILIFLVFVIVRQVSTLKKAKLTISRAHAHQQLINSRLEEANRIKEEYIGYFFSGNSEFYTRLEKFKRTVESRIADRKLDEVSFYVNNLNLKKEREELLKNFDRIFLKLFPNFVDEFNRLLKEEDRIRLKEGELLNTHLRIFALTRMGIHEPEKIAAILEYSVNTINTYKTKIRNKAIVPNDEFEHRIMEIRSVV